MSISKALIEDLAKCFGPQVGTYKLGDDEEIHLFQYSPKPQDETGETETQEGETSSEA